MGARAEDDAERLATYVYPHIGDAPIADVTLDQCEFVMANLPEKLATATRRQVAQTMRRVLTLAVYPGRHRSESPVPKGWLPRPTGPRRKSASIRTRTARS